MLLHIVINLLNGPSTIDAYVCRPGPRDHSFMSKSFTLVNALKGLENETKPCLFLRLLTFGIRKFWMNVSGRLKHPTKSG